MTLGSSLRTLLARWYITVPGTMLSAALAGLVFTLVPMQYSSTGMAVLVQPKQGGASSAAANPLLDFDSGLNTTALILEQSLGTPELKPELLVTPTDTYTVKNTASTDGGAAAPVQPFIYVTAQSVSAEASNEIVDRILQLARQELDARQKAMRVLPFKYIRLQNVIDPTTPQPVLGVPLAATGAALLLGLIATFSAALLSHRSSVRREARRQAAFAARAEEDLRRKLVAWVPSPTHPSRPRGNPYAHVRRHQPRP